MGQEALSNELRSHSEGTGAAERTVCAESQVPAGCSWAVELIQFRLAGGQSDVRPEFNGVLGHSHVSKPVKYSNGFRYVAKTARKGDMHDSTEVWPHWLASMTLVLLTGFGPGFSLVRCV